MPPTSPVTILPDDLNAAAIRRCRPLRSVSLTGTCLKAASCIGLLFPLVAHAGFAEDSQLNLGLRNFYLDRDFCAFFPGTPRAPCSSASMLPLNTPIASTAAVAAGQIPSCPMIAAQESRFATTVAPR